MMTPRKILRAALLVIGTVGLALATPSISRHAVAQDVDDCPDGYYYLEGNGCVPMSYYSGAPDVAPDLGFGFFYGGGWDRGGGYRRGGGSFHGDFHGGGGHFSGGHGGGRR
jgi:hypothetical protein